MKPTYLIPLWDLMGISLGFGTALLGKKAAMLCTASVEEVIENHYENQLRKIGEDEKDLKTKTANKNKYGRFGTPWAAHGHQNAIPGRV